MLDIPDDYDESTAPKTQIRTWEKEVGIHVKNKYQLNTNIRKLFYLIMGQCTEALKAKLRGLPTFQAIEYKNDVMGFLRTIKEVLSKFEEHKKQFLSLFNMKKRTVNYLDPVQYL